MKKIKVLFPCPYCGTILSMYIDSNLKLSKSNVVKKAICFKFNCQKETLLLINSYGIFTQVPIKNIITLKEE